VSSNSRTAWNTYLAQEMIADPLARVRMGPIRTVLDVGCGPESIGMSRFPRGTVLVSTDVREYPSVGVVCTALAHVPPPVTDPTSSAASFSEIVATSRLPAVVPAPSVTTRRPAAVANQARRVKPSLARKSA